MSFQLQRKVQQQLKELKKHSWSTANYRSGHLRNYPGHRVSLGKSFINFCVMSLHGDDDDTHIAKWVVVLLATPHARFDVNFITLPEISCTHITHITHYPSELREHIVQRVLCKVRIRRHISYGGIWHWVDWANRAKPKWLLKIYWIYRQQTNLSWLKVGKTRKNALMHTRPHGQDRYVDN